MATVRLVMNQDGLRALFQGESSAVGRDLAARLRRVQGDARRRCPVDEGRLRSSIETEITTTTRGLQGRVGTNVNYALHVHEGTGIYGKRRRPIVPTRAKVLRFPVKGGVVFTKQVRGSRPRPFLRDALPAAGG